MSLDALLMLSFAAHEVGEFADSYSTSIALTCGKGEFTEGNPIGKWLIAKIGQAGTYAIKMGAFPIGLMVLGILYGPVEKEVMIAQFSLGAVFGVIGALNLIKLKKAGISIALF